KNLGAERSDLEQLMGYIDRKSVSRQQVPGLLKQAYARLRKLRSTLSDFAELSVGNAEMTGLVQHVDSAIQPGDMFSFDNALQALAVIYRRYAKQDDASESVATIFEMQALIAAARLEHHDAAELYSEAAMVPGLSTELQWQHQKERALVLADLGQEFGDNSSLEQAISLLENEILELVPPKQLPADWATTKHVLGNVLGILGQRQGGTRNLENSIAAFQASLSKRDRQQEPIQWAETQNSLGNALGIFGLRVGDEDILCKSIEAFEHALEQRTRDSAPQDWATTQNNLAAVLQSLGQRNKDARMLKRSVEAYKEVLQEWTRERVPLDWATTMNNLGTALRLLGEHRKGPRTLEQSVAAYNSALAERNRERLPQEWAMTQNNLGAALHKLAEREENDEMFKRAIVAYENALKEWTRERLPMAWGMTMANLAVVRRAFAEHTEDIGSARKAVEELEAVSEIFRSASHAQYSELSIDQLAKARKLVDALAGVQHA
ncbi:tetratricopeptide repeat-containing protein, partial [Gammaproteobacteria bacterium]|nr:tetratricopeptide repeat-containing protein [Gammaproteobacteria bacterium]